MLCRSMELVTTVPQSFVFCLYAYYTTYTEIEYIEFEPFDYSNTKRVGVLFNQLVDLDNQLRLHHCFQNSSIYNKLAQTIREKDLNADDELYDIISLKIDNLLNEAVKKDFPEVALVLKLK